MNVENEWLSREEKEIQEEIRVRKKNSQKHWMLLLYTLIYFFIDYISSQQIPVDGINRYGICGERK